MSTYKVTLGRFSATEGINPLEAAMNIANICAEAAFDLIYEVEDEATGERFSIDLADESIYPLPKRISEEKIAEMLELFKKIVEIQKLPAEKYTDGELLDRILDLGIENFLKNIECK